MAKLIFRSGPYAGKSVSLPTGKSIILGRNRDIDLPLPDLKLSRRHCQITYDNEVVTVKDLNSTNGTFLNGMRVVEETVLNPFDRLVVGDTEIEYQEAEKAEEFVAPSSSHDSTSTTRQHPESSMPVQSTVQQARPSPLELAVREMMLPLPVEPEATPVPEEETLEEVEEIESGPAIIERPQLIFCDMCNASIPVSDWQLGNAKEFEGKNYCKHCLAKGVVVGAPVPKASAAPKEKSVDDILAGLNEEAIVVDTTVKRRGVAVSDEQIADSISKFERATNQPAPQSKVPSERRVAVQAAAPAPAKPLAKPPEPPAKPKPAPAPAAPNNLEPLGDEFEEIG